jgi:hypothetical protein
MIVFGGILDVTKELDDMMIFDIEKKRWSTLFDSIHNVQQIGDSSAPLNNESGGGGPSDTSPSRLTNTMPASSALNQTAKSPMRTGKNLEFDTPIGGSPKNSTMMSRLNTTGKKSGKSSRRSSPARKGGLTINTNSAHHQHGGEKGVPHISLESPTSIQMKNSLIIQSSDSNFEHLYKQMVKRKIALAVTSSFTGKQHPLVSGGGGLSEVTSPRGDLLFVKGRRPHARDGHSALVYEGNLIIFGGDRHHMPYNDLFIFDIITEFTIR